MSFEATLGDLERMLPGHDGTSNVVYDEAGTLYCYDTASSTRSHTPLQQWPPASRHLAHGPPAPQRNRLPLGRRLSCGAPGAGYTEQ